jgi:D-alanine-D-alanine ligase
LTSREVVVSVNRGVVRDQFYSERLYGRQDMFELLSEAGFEADAGDEEGLLFPCT